MSVMLHRSPVLVTTYSAPTAPVPERHFVAAVTSVVAVRLVSTKLRRTRPRRRDP